MTLGLNWHSANLWEPPPPPPETETKPIKLVASRTPRWARHCSATWHFTVAKITQSDAFNYMSYHFLCKRGIRPARTEQFLVYSEFPVTVSVNSLLARNSTIHMGPLRAGCRILKGGGGGGQLRSTPGVLNRGEISPMGEILGIQRGKESVWKLLSFQNWWHKMVPLVYFWRINFSHSNTMPFNSRLAVIEINRCQWCHHIVILRYVGLGKGGNNSLVVAKVGQLE